MGAQLVSRVMTQWTHVSDRAFRVLTRMALTALDEPSKDGTPACMYFGGRELLASALSPDERAPYQTVKRALRELVDLGAVQRIGPPARTRQRQVYQLHLAHPLASVDGSEGAPPPDPIDDPLVDNDSDGPVDNRPGGPPQTPTGGPPQTPTGGPPQTPTGGPPQTPLGTTEEPREELSQEPDDQLRNQSSDTARARPPDDEDTPEPTPEPDPDVCHRCGVLLDPDRVCRNRRCDAFDGAAVIPFRRTA